MEAASHKMLPWLAASYQWVVHEILQKYSWRTTWLQEGQGLSPEQHRAKVDSAIHRRSAELSGQQNEPFLDSAITETLGTLPGNVFVKIKEVVKKFDHAMRTTHKLAANSKKLKADVQNIAAGNVPPDVRKWKPAFESKELDRSVQDGNGGNDVQFLLDIDKSLTYRAAKERLHNACVAWNKQLDAQMVDLRIAALAPETRFNKFIDEATSFNTGHLQTLRSLGIDLPNEWFSERRSDEITQAKAGQLSKGSWTDLVLMSWLPKQGLFLRLNSGRISSTEWAR